MFLRRYRRKIAKMVESKMEYMGTCPNEKDIILHIIAPKDYDELHEFHCVTDCWCKDCKNYDKRYRC